MVNKQLFLWQLIGCFFSQKVLYYYKVILNTQRGRREGGCSAAFWVGSPHAAAAAAVRVCYSSSF
jgi:hypothetical protein|tara:strand:- start:667 stop:861 length:195 start_codon:yes stop_codon:yes gene_type:complete